MIRYDNGNFYLHSVRFRIPNNFYINCDTESTTDYFIELRPPQNEYILRLRIIDDCNDTLSEINSYFDEDAGGTPAEPPSVLSVGGMRGHQVVVNGNTVQTSCYYAHLEMPDCENKHVYFYIEVKDGKSMKPILESADIQWFIDNIQHL